MNIPSWMSLHLALEDSQTFLKQDLSDQQEKPSVEACYFNRKVSGFQSRHQIGRWHEVNWLLDYKNAASLDAISPPGKD